MPPAKKDLSYYRALPYPCELTQDAYGGYFARHPDLEGCAAQAETIEEAVASLKVARELWLETQYQDNAHIPEPLDEEPSGRLMLRLPLRLHAALERRAARSGLSLNRLLNEILFKHVNQLPPEHWIKEPAADETEDLGDQENRSLEDYLSQRYACVLLPDEDGGYLAEHPDLPGCSTQGKSAADAIAQLDTARELWIANRLEENLPVPQPLSLEYTGIISLRIPPPLHYRLAQAASRNGISLNQWLVMAISEFTGRAETLESMSWQASRYLAKAQRPYIHQGVNLFRLGFDRRALGLLGKVSKNRADFLIGLLHLERRSFEEAFRSFSAAYVSGLNFSTEAIEMYHEMPNRLSHRELLELVLQLSHVILADTQERKDVHLLLVAWLDCVRNKSLSQQQWRRWGREQRNQELAKVLDFDGRAGRRNSAQRAVE